MKAAEYLMSKLGEFDFQIILGYLDRTTNLLQASCIASSHMDERIRHLCTNSSEGPLMGETGRLLVLNNEQAYRATTLEEGDVLLGRWLLKQTSVLNIFFLCKKLGRSETGH